MKFIDIKNIIYEYFRRDDQGQVSEIVQAVDDVSLEVVQGEFIAILGHNGSGKSTLAKHLNGLLLPSEGTVLIEGMNTKENENIYKIRENIGLVFQNPDNQIIGSLVDEDVAFGPENLGVSSDEIWDRVIKSLEAVGMSEYISVNPNKLSGGQKQRVAIAGIVAMNPKCIVLDEPTAMLDPKGRMDVLKVIKELNEKKKITIILITHNVEEVLEADKIFIMDKGKVVCSGTPKEVFSNSDKLSEIGLEIPRGAYLSACLQKKSIASPKNILFEEELIKWLIDNKPIVKIKDNKAIDKLEKKMEKSNIDLKESIILDKVSFTYDENTNMQNMAIRNVSMTIGKGQFISVIGHTGSGKTSLIKLFNGLLRPQNGNIYYNGCDIWEKGFNRKDIRSKVGMVFQYPEYQLFGNTVFEDVCYGPFNLGLEKLQVQKRAFEAIESVGLGDWVYDLSPFELSGGQKRRVAIAGVLAMSPEYLILDEPAAGLDPKGRDEILKLISSLVKEIGMTVIMVSHSMEDVVKYSDRVIVMEEGQVKYDDITENVFSHYKELEHLGLSAPYITYFVQKLSQRGFPIKKFICKENEAIDEIVEVMEKDGVAY